MEKSQAEPGSAQVPSVLLAIDVEAVRARRQVGVEGLPSRAGIHPVGVEAFEPVAEPRPEAAP